jgi:hypothetical protein
MLFKTCAQPSENSPAMRPVKRPQEKHAPLEPAYATFDRDRIPLANRLAVARGAVLSRARRLSSPT